MRKTSSLVLIIGTMLFSITACDTNDLKGFFGNPSINDYVEDYAVQSLLIVGEPIENVVIMRSLNVSDSFTLDKAAVRDAIVRIVEANTGIILPLVFDGTTLAYKSLAGATLKSNTTYTLEASVRTMDGTLLTLRGTTTTPAQIQWIRAPKDTLWYPKDTTRLPSPDSLLISWTPIAGITDYIFSTECLDTLRYGNYLRPPTTESNRRIERFFEKQLPRYNEPVRAGIRAVTSTPVIWTAFKWFGVQETRIYAPDNNFANWFRQVNFSQNPRYNYRLGSIENGKGVFGSASLAKKVVFVVKNQP
jgi:hypothetical protein